MKQNFLEVIGGFTFFGLVIYGWFELENSMNQSSEQKYCNKIGNTTSIISDYFDEPRTDKQIRLYKNCIDLMQHNLLSADCEVKKYLLTYRFDYETKLLDLKIVEDEKIWKKSKIEKRKGYLSDLEEQKEFLIDDYEQNFQIICEINI